MSKIYRTSDNNLIAGVLGGFAKHLKIDASILRIVYALLLLFGDDIFKTTVVSTILFAFYIICWIIIPEQ